MQWVFCRALWYQMIIGHFHTRGQTNCLNRQIVWHLTVWCKFLWYCCRLVRPVGTSDDLFVWDDLCIQTVCSSSSVKMAMIVILELIITVIMLFSALPPLKETRKPPEVLKPFKPSSPPKEVRKTVLINNLTLCNLSFSQNITLTKKFVLPKFPFKSKIMQPNVSSCTTARNCNSHRLSDVSKVLIAAQGL